MGGHLRTSAAKSPVISSRIRIAEALVIFSTEPPSLESMVYAKPSHAFFKPAIVAKPADSVQYRAQNCAIFNTTQ